MPATTSTSIAFTAEVEQVNDRTLVRLPADASAALPSRGQVAVTAAVDGEEFTTVVEPDGRRGHWLRVDGAEPGTTVSLELTPTKQWPEPEVPQDFREALDGAPDIAETWEDITPMARWEWVRWIGATKSAATRQRRVEVGIDKLRNGKRRPCCFDLSSCTDPEVAKSGVLIGSS